MKTHNTILAAMIAASAIVLPSTPACSTFNRSQPRITYPVSTTYRRLNFTLDNAWVIDVNREQFPGYYYPQRFVNASREAHNMQLHFELDVVITERSQLQIEREIETNFRPRSQIEHVKVIDETSNNELSAITTTTADMTSYGGVLLKKNLTVLDVGKFVLYSAKCSCETKHRLVDCNNICGTVLKSIKLTNYAVISSR